jgi:hypothetical protein
LYGTQTDFARLASTSSSNSSYETVNAAARSSEIHISMRTGSP